MGFIRLRLELRAVRRAIEELRRAIQGHSEAIHAAEETQRHTDPPRQPTPAIISYDEQTTRDAKTEQNRQYGIQKSIRNWARAAVIAASIYAAIAALQWHEMRKATDTARDTLIRSQRPWLVNDGEATFMVDSSNEDSVSLSFTFHVKNFGPSPALDVGYGLHPFVRNVSDKPNLFDEARTQACELADGMVKVRGDSIFPRRR
jgi:hypothetical protein